jgi:hypothetical protein
MDKIKLALLEAALAAVPTFSPGSIAIDQTSPPKYASRN